MSERRKKNEGARKAGLAALARHAVPNSLAYQQACADIQIPGTSAQKRSLAVENVFFTCSYIGRGVFSKEEWRDKIRIALYEELEIDQIKAVCLIIHNLNPPSKIHDCVETLIIYLNNIINNPNEEKYKKIRISNKIYQDKIASMEGVHDFLKIAGFVDTSLKIDGILEEYLIFNTEVDGIYLNGLIEALKNTEKIELEVYRNPVVLLPNQAASMTELPDAFYTLSPSEIKREQQQKSQILERESQLRTKAMREKEEQKNIRKYKYSLIRVRFPDGLVLQGTFSVHEKFENVRKFVKESITVSGQIVLKTALGASIEENQDKFTLLELKLVPAVILLFVYNSKYHPQCFISSELKRSKVA